ncbi:hypothetical protein ACFQE1_10295 [Halobium palmae]|uniref:Uncharacterized protein n=1 Tax=Halobium palmae TaxID=1776492 RepID=A0ABD5RZ89_9EURY
MFDARSYEVRQKLGIRTRYNVYEDGTDDPILQSKKKSFRLKEDFRFTDPRTGEEAFRVTTGKILDINAAYDIEDSRTGEPVGAVKRSMMSFLKHEYQLLDPDGNVVATLTEDNHLMALLRRKVTTLIPFNYDIVSPSGEKVGDVSERFSLRDRYDIDLYGDDVDPRLAVVGTVVVDAIEGN